MYRTRLLPLVLVVSGAAAAHAAGGVVGAATGGGPSGGAHAAVPAATTATNGSVATSTTAVANTAGTALTPPPPLSVTQSPAAVGVPAIPAPPTTNSLVSTLQTSNGLSPAVNNELRPSSSLNAAQVADVQATLAAGGLYSGPIDGLMSGATRAAISQYQNMQQLPVTGQLDAETVTRLSRGATSVGGSGGTNAAGAAGNRGNTPASSAAVTPLLPTPTGVNPTPTITSTQVPFALSSTVSLSPLPAPGTTIQP